MSDPISALTIPSRGTEEALSLQEVIARAHKIQQVMETVMVEGVHYGKIPGTLKPSLWQPGAEKLMLVFQLAPDEGSTVVEEISSSEAVRYRVFMHLRHVPTGAIVGFGVGECSSDEEKYRWRKVVCQQEYDEAPEDRRRKKWSKSKREEEPYQVLQVRTEPADIANTVLKMAKKRALVDAAKSTTGASDIFDQDVEDLANPGGDADGATPPPPRAVGTPKARAARSAGNGGSASGEILVPLERWAAAKKRMHEKGVISEKQAGRLFAIAAQHGWSRDDVAREVRAGLGVEPDAIPFGDPYEQAVAIFEEAKPKAPPATPTPPAAAAPDRAETLADLDVWEAIKEGWGKEGPIPIPKLNKLKLVGETSGWTREEMDALVTTKLGVELAEIPAGKPYELLLGFFEAKRV